MLLQGSAVDDSDGEWEEEEVLADEQDGEPSVSQLFVRAVVASTDASGASAVSALVRMARSSTSQWLEKLSSAGHNILAVKVVSLAPHASTSIEAQLQGKLTLLRAELDAEKAEARAALASTAEARASVEP